MTNNDYISGKYYQTVYFQKRGLEFNTKWMGNYYSAVKKVFPRIENYKNNSILEIGSGYGAYINLLNKKGFTDVTASDLNNTIYEKTLENPYLNIDITKDSTLPVKKFDLIFAFDVLEHIEDTQSAINNINKLLNEGGHFIFCVPFPSAKHLYDTYHTNMQYPSFYTNLFNRMGFCLQSLKIITFVPFVWRYVFPIVLCWNSSLKFTITEIFFCFKKPTCLPNN